MIKIMTKTTLFGTYSAAYRSVYFTEEMDEVKVVNEIEVNLSQQKMTTIRKNYSTQKR